MNSNLQSTNLSFTSVCRGGNGRCDFGGDPNNRMILRGCHGMSLFDHTEDFWEGELESYRVAKVWRVKK